MEFIFIIAIFLVSVVLHEVSHGVVAYALGDPTAKEANRLTLNPIPHLDPFGSVILPFLMYAMTSGGVAFGWAKPVPVNPALLRDQRWGQAKVSLAGPASNLLLALVFGILLRFFPFDILAFIVYVNLLLALFNLVPIPPLDGSHLLFSLLPNSLHQVRLFLLQYGFMLLLIFILFFFDWIRALASILFSLIVGTPF